MPDGNQPSSIQFKRQNSGRKNFKSKSTYSKKIQPMIKTEKSKENFLLSGMN
jgi:hypothetical protein